MGVSATVEMYFKASADIKSEDVKGQIVTHDYSGSIISGENFVGEFLDHMYISIRNVVKI